MTDRTAPTLPIRKPTFIHIIRGDMFFLIHVFRTEVILHTSLSDIKKDPLFEFLLHLIRMCVISHKYITCTRSHPPVV